ALDAPPTSAAAGNTDNRAIAPPSDGSRMAISDLRISAPSLPPRIGAAQQYWIGAAFSFSFLSSFLVYLPQALLASFFSLHNPVPQGTACECAVPVARSSAAILVKSIFFIIAPLSHNDGRRIE